MFANRKMTKWDTEHQSIKWKVHQSLGRMMHFWDTYLWKTSSSFIALPEESQFKSQKPLAWDPSTSDSREATFAAEEPSSYFLWPKSQFGLLSCISLGINRQSATQQNYLKLPIAQNSFCFHTSQTNCPLFPIQNENIHGYWLGWKGWLTQKLSLSKEFTLIYKRSL